MAIYESSTPSSPSSLLLNLLYSALVPGGRSPSFPSSSSSSNTKKMDHHGVIISSRSSDVQISKTTLGWTACVGISLLILQYIGNRRRELLAAGGGGDDNDDSILSGSDAGTLYRAVAYQLARWRDLFFFSSRTGGEDYDEEEDFDGESFVVHQGSCHCGSIAFEVSAPLVLHVEEVAGDGKLLYPSMRVPESSFRLLRGEEEWQTYHVPDEHSPATQAFSFCRKCGFHLVHAIDSDPFMVSVNVNTLTTPWKRAKPRSLAMGGASAFRRVGGRSKKRPAASRNSAPTTTDTATTNTTNMNYNNNNSRGTSNSQSPGTPNRAVSPTNLNRSNTSPISFDSGLADSVTPPPTEDGKPVGEFVKQQEPSSPPYLNSTTSKGGDSLSVASDGYSFGGSQPLGGYQEEPSPNPFALKRKPNPRYAASSSVSDWPTDTTDTSSYLYADDENSLYEDASVMSSQTEPLPPSVGGTPRNGAAISSNYALREKLRSHMSKHMKTHSHKFHH